MADMLLEPAGMISRFVFTQYNQVTQLTGVKSPKFPTVVVARYRLCHPCATSRPDEWRHSGNRQCLRHALRTAHSCFSSHCFPIRGKRPGGHSLAYGYRENNFLMILDTAVKQMTELLCEDLQNYLHARTPILHSSQHNS